MMPQKDSPIFFEEDTQARMNAFACMVAIAPDRYLNEGLENMSVLFGLPPRPDAMRPDPILRLMSDKVDVALTKGPACAQYQRILESAQSILTHDIEPLFLKLARFNNVQIVAGIEESSYTGYSDDEESKGTGLNDRAFIAKQSSTATLELSHRVLKCFQSGQLT